MNLYQLSKQHDDLIASIVDEDGVIDDEYIHTFERVHGELSVKRRDVASYVLNLGAEIDAINHAIGRMEDRFTALVKRKSSFEKYLREHMERYGITEIKCDEFVVKLKDNPESVIIDDELLIPDEFIKTEVKRSVMKNEIKKVIQEGREVEGAHLERTKKLIFK